MPISKADILKFRKPRIETAEKTAVYISTRRTSKDVVPGKEEKTDRPALYVSGFFKRHTLI
jgi:hypothetical protein